MSTADSPSDKSVLPYRPSQKFRAAVGRIILAGGELDHLISLSLFKASGLSQDTGFILFGRASISTKMSNLRYLVKTGYKPGPTIEEFSELAQDLQAFSRIRNTVDHGTIVGLADGHIIFNLYAEYKDMDGFHVNEAVGTTESTLVQAAKAGEALQETVRFYFDVHPLHKTGNYLPSKKPAPAVKATQ